MAICVECEYKAFHIPEGSDFADHALQCSNADLPISDYVYGYRYCEQLNPRGQCKGFKSNSETGCIKPETIYELKEDEELAELGAQVINSLADKGIKP